MPRGGSVPFIQYSMICIAKFNFALAVNIITSTRNFYVIKKQHCLGILGALGLSLSSFSASADFYAGALVSYSNRSEERRVGKECC